MRQLLTIDNPDLAGRFVSVCHTDGLPLTAEWILGQITLLEGK